MFDSTHRKGNLRDLVTICVAFFFAFLGTGASQPFIVSYLADMKGLGAMDASMVLAVVYVTFVVFRFLIGFIIDVTGVHLAKILGITTYAAFPLFVYRADSLPVLLVGSVLWGIGAPMLWTASLVQIVDTSSPTRYATSIGVLRGTVMTAMFAGSFLLSAIYGHRDYSLLFLLSMGLGLLGVLAMVASPYRRVRRDKPSLRTFLRVVKERDARIVCAFLLCSGFGYGLILNGFKPYIEAACGKQWLQFILPVHALAGILSSLVGGWVCDAIGRWRTFTWGFAIGAVGLTVGSLWPGPVLLTFAMLCIGLQFAVVPLSAMAWIGDMTTPADRPSVSGYVLCFRDAGIAAVIIMGGLISRTAATFAVLAAVSALCGAVALFRSARTPSS